MFDLLKKKISGFIDKFTKKEEAPQQKEAPAEEKKLEQPKAEQIPKETPVEPKVAKEEIKPEEKIEPKKESPKIDTKKVAPKSEPLKKEEPIQPKKIEKKEQPHKAEPPPKIEVKAPEVKPKILIEKFPQVEKIELPEKKAEPPEKKPEPKKQEKKVNLGFIGQVKSIITGQVEIGKNEVQSLLEELELELIEGDVALEVSQEIVKNLESKLVGQKVKRGEVDSFIKNAIRETLLGVMVSAPGFDVLQKINSSEKPFKIMVIGINGAGKTTTIAKLASLFMEKGLKVAFASADTFRAAAIEQMQVHADRLGVKNIKRDYGSDPTAVAYDAVNYSRAHNLDVVLIDTAGRQETDLNLLNELKKMSRIIKPDLKVYVGESIAGNAIISQVAEFNKEIGIDGVILTKLDCDAKGGTVLSITKMTSVPILFLGVGQKYEDLESFNPEKILDALLS